MCFHSPCTPARPLAGGSQTSAGPDRWEEHRGVRPSLICWCTVSEIFPWQRGTHLVIDKKLRHHWKEAKGINSWEEGSSQSRGRSGRTNRKTTETTHQWPECWPTTSNTCEGRKKKKDQFVHAIDEKPERCSDPPVWQATTFSPFLPQTEQAEDGSSEAQRIN